MLKKFLCAPGPTPVPPEVLSEMSKPLIHHRTPQFSKIVAENAEMLKKVFKTQNPVVTLTSSGTGAMESSITNFMSKGDKIIVLAAGKFGERFAEIGKAYDLEVIELKAEWGKDVKPAELEETLKKNPDVKGVYTEYSETCTGVAFEIEALAKVVAKTNAIFIVDGITAIGAMEFKMDEWGVDVALAGSQKSLMIPPGLAFIAVSPKAQKFMETATLPKYYFNIAKEIKSLAKDTTAWTPPVSLYIGLNVALKMMIEEGMDNVIKRHAIIGECFRQSVQAIGLKLFPDASVTPSDSAISVKIPEGIEGGKLPGMMRDKYGVTIAGGQDHIKGKIFRLGSLGYIDKSDVLIELQALEYTLNDLGYKFDIGASVAFAQKYLVANLKY